MSGTVDDSSLAPTALSILIGRGMETAFLMVDLQTLVRPLLVCLCACVCVSESGDVSCKKVVVRCWYD